MAFRLKRSESVPEGVRRIAREEMGSAAKLLRNSSGIARDEAIHEARKSIKKVRALMRLVEPQLDGAYAEENARLRDAGRKLSQVRDAKALITAFDELKVRREVALRKRSLGSIRRMLVLHKSHVEEKLGLGELPPKIAGTLAEVRKAAKRWPLEKDGMPAIEAGLEKAFRRGRKALRIANQQGNRENFHQWRKRVKDHWYHVRLLENLWSDVLQGYEHSLKELEDALGEDLNLALLRERIASAPEGYGGAREIDAAEKAIDAAQHELQARALEIGERVYAEKPQRLVKLARRLWKTWKR